MANPFDALDGPVRDLHWMAGWNGTVFNGDGSYFDDAGGDWVDGSGDPTLADHYDAGTDATIRIEARRAPTDTRSDASREVYGDVVVIADPSEVDLTSGDEATLPSIIRDDRTGELYRVLRVRDENTGLLRADCETYEP